MTIDRLLTKFYKKNNLSAKGGESDDWFYLKFKFFSLKLPNSQFRKDVIYVHDIQHVLYDCDTTWKGEAFIAGWEIATGMWKHFPIGIMSLWAMGFSLFQYPKEVFRGYKEGLNAIGIIDLKIKKEVLLNLSVLELKKLICKKEPEKTIRLKYVVFAFWCMASLTIFLLPILLPLLLIFQLLS